MNVTGYRKGLGVGIAVIALTGLVLGSAAQAGGYKTTGASAAQAHGDIVDTAISAGSFNTLVAAVQKAGLVSVLKGEGPFTVFAPTDDAFARVPKSTLDALLSDKEALVSVLTYHVVPGKVMAADVVGLTSATTIQGEAITIDSRAGVKVDAANVVKTDIETSNGVIHVIDAVILPEEIAAMLSRVGNLQHHAQSMVDAR